MILLQRLSPQQRCLRLAAKGIKTSKPISRATTCRRVHTVPKLTNADAIKEYGYPDFLSPDGVRIAWTEYMELIVGKLNRLTAGLSVEGLDAKALLLTTARDPRYALVFNYASMAWNNHFFFNGLTLDTSNPQFSHKLLSRINKDFSSVDTLREEMLGSAEAMFGPGFVWLVKQRDRDNGQSLRIMNTYLAGTPLSGAHWREQPVDMNTQSPSSLGGGLSGADYRRQTVVQNTVGSIGRYSTSGKKQQRLAPGGVDVVPLLCVNTWEHVWLQDFGITGKRKYLEAWWNRINWKTAGDLDGPDFGGNSWPIV